MTDTTNAVLNGDTVTMRERRGASDGGGGSGERADGAYAGWRARPTRARTAIHAVTTRSPPISRASSTGSLFMA